MIFKNTKTVSIVHISDVGLIDVDIFCVGYGMVVEFMLCRLK